MYTVLRLVRSGPSDRAAVVLDSPLAAQRTFRNVLLQDEEVNIRYHHRTALQLIVTEVVGRSPVVQTSGAPSQNQLGVDACVQKSLATGLGHTAFSRPKLHMIDA